VGGEARLEEQAEAQASAREKFERFSESCCSPHGTCGVPHGHLFLTTYQILFTFESNKNPGFVGRNRVNNEGLRKELPWHLSRQRW
jgi:hypothetical protein